jgi:phosphatidylglycerol---prolipoprotein diacylglyceryl transferase
VGQRSRTDRRRGTTERSRGARPRLAVPQGTHPAQAQQPPAAATAVTDGATAEQPDPAALVVSHWFESGPQGGPPFNALVRVTGRRRDVPGRPLKGDTFSVTETVSGVMPGSGRVTTTSWIYNVNPGDWDVTAELVGPERARAATPDLHLPRAGWSWRRWSLQPTSSAPYSTRWALLAPLAATPAVLPGSFTVLAVVAIVAAILSQPFFLGWLGVDAGAAVLASVVGLVAGLVGAKAWYMVLKGPSRASLKEGWSVDGFLVTAPLVAALLAAAQGLSVAAFLDGVTPGIFLAVAIGRVGCFLTGCCAGRPTAGWGIWSSDRRVGSRRIPTQLLESALGLVLATLSSILLLGHVAGGSGLVFVGAVAIYLVARQGLLRLRAEARPFSWRRAPGRVAAGSRPGS